MNQNSLWKNLLIAAVLIVGVFFALPNLFGEDPAVQISAERGLSVDTELQARVLARLDQSEIGHIGSSVEQGRLLVRLVDEEAQLKALDAVRRDLGNQYNVALNLAPATPVWLEGLGALPMYLGLDLRGGVHFLLEVDMEAAVAQAEERYVGDLRSMSMAIPVRVLIREIAWAPPSATALAMTVMSVTLGDSLTMTGLSVLSTTLRVTSPDIFGSTPKAIPP